jgi:hypothetical protein
MNSVHRAYLSVIFILIEYLPAILVSPIFAARARARRHRPLLR